MDTYTSSIQDQCVVWKKIQAITPPPPNIRPKTIITKLHMLKGKFCQTSV